MNRPESLLGRVDRTGWPLLLARLALGVMFVWMGVAKILDPVEREIFSFRQASLILPRVFPNSKMLSFRLMIYCL